MELHFRKADQPVVFFFGALIGLTFFRGICNTIFPLTGEEAYYWMWSRHLALCYFDHPPLIAWIIRLSETLLGHSVFAVRFPALLSNTLTGATIFWCAWRITRDRAVAAWAGGFFLVTLFFTAAATIAIPDSYLFLFWALTLWLTIEATREGRQIFWLPAGVTLGLSMLTKFHGILLALSMATYLLISPRQRKQLRCGWFYLGMLLAGLLTLPIFLWNLQEGWPTFGFQLAGRHQYVLGNPVYFIEMLTVPFAYIGPLLFPLSAVGTVWGLFKGLKEGCDDLLFLSIACLLPYLFFLILSVFIKIDAQWASPGFLSGLIVASMLGKELVSNSLRYRPWQRKLPALSLKVNAVLLLCIYALGFALLVLPDLLPRDLVFVKHRSRRATTRKLGAMYGWEEIGRRLQEEINLLGGPEKTFIYGRKGRCTSSTFCFYSGGQAETFVFDCPPQKGNQFYIWERKADLKGMNAVVVAKKQKYIDLEFLNAHFKKVEGAPDLVIKRGGAEQQHLYIVRAWDLQEKPNQHCN